MSRYQCEAYVCLWQHNFYVELGVGGAEVFAGTDNNEPSCQEIRDSNCPFI